jgi:hypothetical protein
MKANEVAKQIVFDFGYKVEFAIKQGKDYGIVTNIKLGAGSVLYMVTWSDKECSPHYEFELIKAS